MPVKEYKEAIIDHLERALKGVRALPEDQTVVRPSVDDDRLFKVIRQIGGGTLTQSQVDRVNAVLYNLPEPPVQQLGLTQRDFEDAAMRLGVTVAQIRAVDEVESGGGWFTDVRGSILDLDGPGGFLDGPHLPKILFEAHIFDRETGGKFRQSHPNLSSARWNRALYVGGQGEYERLHKAMQLDRTSALKAASWGRYQIMGFNHKLAGYPDVESFVEAMKENERNHLDAFVSFIENSKLVDALRKVSNVHADNIPFARGYNGAGYAANEYHIKIARAHAKFSR